MAGADPFAVSERAKQRGKGQLGTLGSGNHFLEVQYVDEVFDEDTAFRYNLKKGQPVFIPGSMGTASYFLLGQEGAMRETFGSACHGAGRVMSRSAAKKGVTAKEIQKDLESRGIIVESLTREGLTEEKPEAYKDIESVVDVVHNAGLASRVARLRPMGVIKG